MRTALDRRILLFYVGLALMSGATSFNARSVPVVAAAEGHQAAWELFWRGGSGAAASANDSNAVFLSRRPLMLALTAGVARATHAPWPYAFALVRLASILLAYVVFHRSMLGWFRAETAVLATVFVAASMALAFTTNVSEILSDYPELLTFTLGMAALRAGRPYALAIVTFLGTLNRETAALLPLIALAHMGLQWREGRRDPRFLLATLLGWVTATLLVGWWLSTGNPLGVYASRLSWLQHNLSGLMQLLTHPHPYNNYLFPAYVFGVFWILPLTGWGRLPLVLRAGVCAAPLFLLVVVTVGALNEPRELAPLYPILVPASLLALFPVHESGTPPPGDR